MRIRRRAAAAGAVIAVMAAWGSAAEARGQEPATEIRSVQLPPELDRVLRDYEDAWRAGDAARLAALFHEDGFVLSPERAPVRGRAAIAERYQGAGGPLHLRALDYATQDTVGYIVGLYGGGPDHVTGKFLLALRRADPGQPWLIAADMDNALPR